MGGGVEEAEKAGLPGGQTGKPQEWAFSFLEQKTWAEVLGGGQGVLRFAEGKGPGGEEKDQGGTQHLPRDNSGSSGQAREATPASTGEGRGTQRVPGAAPRPASPHEKGDGNGEDPRVGPCSPVSQRRWAWAWWPPPKSSGCCSELQASVPGRTSLLGLDPPHPATGPRSGGQRYRPQSWSSQRGQSPGHRADVATEPGTQRAISPATPAPCCPPPQPPIALLSLSDPHTVPQRPPSHSPVPRQGEQPTPTGAPGHRWLLRPIPACPLRRHVPAISPCPCHPVPPPS